MIGTRKHHLIIIGIITVWMLLMGCGLLDLFIEQSESDFWEYEGPDAIKTATPKTDYGTGETVITPEVEEAVEPSISTPAPTSLPEEPLGLDEEAAEVETNEYSVSATNFDCTCQVDGNVTQAISIRGDQLFLGVGDDQQVYDKISENKYKRSWMGYYISVIDGEETKVDEEKSVVITLTDTGYVMEHFSGSSGSPCCFHTFTQIK